MEATDTSEYGEFNAWGTPGMSHVTATDSTYLSSGSRRSSARCEAELIQARGRISQLELELELSKTERAAKRARTEDSDEEDGERLTSTTSQELQRLHTLDEERQSLAEQLAETQERLRERERGEGEEVTKLQALMADLERKDREKTSTMEELQSELSALRNENRLLGRQLEVAQRGGVAVREGLEEQLETQTKAAGILRDRMRELDGVREKWEAEQERVKELQHRLRKAKHDIQFAESIQSKLLHGETEERELRQLREENSALRSHADNVGLMRYQLQTLREQVEQNGDLERRTVRLEEENKLLREQLENCGEDGHKSGGRSAGLQRQLTELQHREVVLLNQVGELESKFKLAQRSAERAELLAEETKKQLAREQEECRARGEKVQRLEKRLLFVSKLRDGCMNVLNSYRLESGVDALLKQNLSEVEKQLVSANDRIAELEAEVEQLPSAKEQL